MHHNDLVFVFMMSSLRGRGSWLIRACFFCLFRPPQHSQEKSSALWTWDKISPSSFFKGSTSSVAALKESPQVFLFRIPCLAETPKPPITHLDIYIPMCLASVLAAEQSSTPHIYNCWTYQLYTTASLRYLSCATFMCFPAPAVKTFLELHTLNFNKICVSLSFYEYQTRFASSHHTHHARR